MKKHPQFAILSVTAATISLLFMATTSLAQPRYPTNYPAKYPRVDYKAERIVLRPCRPRPNILRDGIYLGVGVGYDSYRIRQSVNVLDDDGIFDSANPAISGRGVVGDVFAGYGQYFEWFYIAGEIFTKYTSTHSGYTLNDYNSDFTVRQTYGASIIPGVRVNKAALIYARTGYSRTFFKVQENGTPIGNLGASNWGNGIDIGLGAEIAVYQNFSVRGDYVYTNYSSFRSQLGTKFSPSNSEFTLGLLYHFCL